MSQNESKKPESKIFMLQEMLDSMRQSIENAKSVCEHQSALIEIIKQHGDERFDKFVKDMSESVKKTEKTIETLEYRANRLEWCLKSIEGADMRPRLAVEALIEAFGLFGE